MSKLIQTFLILFVGLNLYGQTPLVLDCDFEMQCNGIAVDDVFVNGTQDSLCILSGGVTTCIAGTELEQLFTFGTDTDVSNFTFNTTQDSICITEGTIPVCLSILSLFENPVAQQAIKDLLRVDSSFSSSTCLGITPILQTDGSYNFDFSLDYDCIATTLGITDISGFYVNGTQDSLCVDEGDVHLCVSGTDLAALFTPTVDTDVSVFEINTTQDSLCIEENGTTLCLSVQSVFDLPLFRNAVIDLLRIDSSFSNTGCLEILPIAQADGSINFQFDLDYACIQTQLNITNPDSLLSTDTCLIVSPVLQGDGSYHYEIDYKETCLGGQDKHCETRFDTLTESGNLKKIALKDCFIDDVLVSTDTVFKECLNCVQDITPISTKDTLYGGYTVLRSINPDSLSDIFFLQDWDNIAPSGENCYMKGGVFRKVWLAGAEDGMTIIRSSFNNNIYYHRDWDGTTTQLEWLECGGLDHEGNNYKGKNISSHGIYNNRDRFNSASRKAGKGGTVLLQPVSTIDIDIDVPYSDDMTIIGNETTLRRHDLIASTLAINVNVGANSLQVVDASNFRVGHRIVIASGLGDNEVSAGDFLYITSISGSTINFSGSLSSNWSTGDNVFVVTNLLSGSSQNIQSRSVLSNLVFHGNRESNNLTKSWRLNASVVGGGNQITVIDKCHSTQTPSENFINGGFIDTEGSTYDSLAHGYAHISVSSLVNFSHFANIEGTNSHVDGYDLNVSGHGLAVISYSVNTRGIKIDNCKFSNGNRIFGTMGNDDTGLSITNSEFKNFKGIGEVIVDGNLANNSETEIENIYFDKNLFESCGDLVIRSSFTIISQGTFIKNVNFTRNEVYNSRFWLQGIGYLKFSGNKILRKDGLHGFAGFTSQLQGEERALVRLSFIDRVDISFNEIADSENENPFVRCAIFFRIDEGFRRKVGDGDATNTDFLYPQMVNISKNKIDGFRFGIGFLDGDVFSQRNTAFVGWKFDNNEIFIRRNLGAAGRGYGIQSYPGIIVQNNTIWSYEVAADAPGILGIGVHNAGTGLRGSHIVGNTVLGLGKSIVAGSLVLPAWGQHGSFVANNYTTTPIIDNSAGNSTVVDNYSIAVPSYKNEEIRGFQEDKTDY